MKFLRISTVLTLLLFSFSGLGCAQNDSLQKKYGHDSEYFVALNSFKESNREQALRHLKNAAKKGSPLVSRRAMEKIAETGNLQERAEFSRNLYKKFQDEESLMYYCRELFRQKEFYGIISNTESIDYEKSKNELCYYRLFSMLQKKDSRLNSEFHRWLVECSYSEWHDKFYRDYSKYENSTQNLLAEFRRLVFLKDYISASEKINDVLDSKGNRKAAVFSDIGKALLYGQKDYAKSAQFMDSIGKNCPKECGFYCDFYSGRFHEKMGSLTVALEKFQSAYGKSGSPAQQDNALWYILNTRLKISTESAVRGIEEFGAKINDREYYEDFFDTLSTRILASRQWNLFRQATDAMDKIACKEVNSKFSYITARLIQTGFIKEDESKARQYLEKAMDCGTKPYYKFLAMEKLSYPMEKTSRQMKHACGEKKITVDPNAEKLLYGYADFGLAELIYSEYEKQKNCIGSDCILRTAEFLRMCGREDEKYLVQSIRIASGKIHAGETDGKNKLLSCAYPKNFNESVEKNCSDFGLPEYFVYALIHSESYFDPIAVSRAGATGLTQLMDSTAADVAKKLRVSEYDLTDGPTNIRFGSFYLKELTERLDGSKINAALSYNCGISRVRSWLKSASIEFGTNKIPSDLFVEFLPYAETREYGRKIITASAIYGWLYYGKNIPETVREILN